MEVPVSSPAAHARQALRIERKPSTPLPQPGLPFVLFGVVLPIVALAIELSTHQCAEAFFDPIPTWLHVVLVALVPLGNLAVCLAAWRGSSSRPRALGHFNAFTIGVAFAYTLLFAVLMPLAIFAIIMMGWGLLPLAPFFSLILALRGRRMLRLIPDHPMPPVWAGFFAALAIMAFPVAHQLATSYALNLAVSSHKQDASRGVWLLRHFGNRDRLVAACYGQSAIWPAGLLEDRLQFAGRLEQVQQIFYRVTGDAYNSLPAPTFAMGRSGRGKWNFDPHIGGSQVADKVAGLSLKTSRQEGRVDAAAGTSYVEWTMEFQNIAANASEARAQIDLPPGGVVSRLTLWINGEPREAAFGARNQVRQAYQEIAVVQRRDPVLVTTSGPDRVLVQCFPVPRDGGTMKVRLGITAPLRMLGEHESGVIVPRLVETNFAVPGELHHEMVFTGDQPLGERGKKAGVRWERGLSDDDLRSRPLLTTQRAANSDVWSDDPIDPSMIIRQTIRRENVPAPARVVFVIDGSKRVGDAVKEIAQALGSLSQSQAFSIYFAGDDVEILPPGSTAQVAEKWLRKRHFIGGRDNLPALLQAWDDVALTKGSALVWIHGPQAVVLSELDPLLKRFEKAGTSPAFYDLAVAPGANRVLEQAADFHTVRSVDFTGQAIEDLRHLLALWSGAAMEFVAERTRVPRAEPLAEQAKADRHVARLWGLEEIERLRATQESASLDKAVKLALALQLVTPVSGAVVLETKEQYDRNGLKPVPPESTPHVPEPSTLLLLAGGAALWVGSCRLRRHAIPG